MHPTLWNGPGNSQHLRFKKFIGGLGQCLQRALAVGEYRAFGFTLRVAPKGVGDRWVGRLTMFTRSVVMRTPVSLPTMMVY